MTELRGGNVVTLEANPGVFRPILVPQAKRLRKVPGPTAHPSAGRTLSNKVASIYMRLF